VNVIEYKEIPSLSQWQKDSSVTLAVRTKEPGLIRIDELIADYANSANVRSERGPLLIDLFLTIEYWFKMRETVAHKVEEGRLPAMRGLFDIVVKRLGPYFADRDGRAATSAGVANGIKEFTGLGMSKHGYVADRNMGFAKFSAEQVWSYRLWFKGGRAYQVPWWSGHPNGKFELANSKHGYSPMIRRDPGNAVAPAMIGWSPFIMSLSRFIYMTKHPFDATSRNNNYFHSSYNDGHRVAMAGTIHIDQGIIRAVRLDSGHYQPGVHNLTAFLWALRMYQVDLNSISMLDYRGDWVGGIDVTAETFLRSGKSWEQFCKAAPDEASKTRATRGDRMQRFPGV
jgi:hypothetical protein